MKDETMDSLSVEKNEIITSNAGIERKENP